jgi:hypothetical protein
LAEQRYFSSTKKKILYNDLYSYTIFNVPAGGNFSEIITNGIARPRYLLIYPMLAEAANGVQAITSTSGGLGSPMNSPSSSAPGTCCPFAFLTNFNVQLSGTNIYQSNLNYTFETFLQNFRGGNSLNGGISNEMSSGLIDKNRYESGYGIVYADLSLKPSQASDKISRSVQVLDTNNSLVSLDLFCILAHEKDILVSTSTRS